MKRPLSDVPEVTPEPPITVLLRVPSISTAGEESVTPPTVVWLHGAPSVAVGSSIRIAAFWLAVKPVPAELPLRVRVNWRAGWGVAVLMTGTVTVLEPVAPSAHASVPLTGE